MKKPERSGQKHKKVPLTKINFIYHEMIQFLNYVYKVCSFSYNLSVLYDLDIYSGLY